jgi:hypothetical protein
MKLKWHNEGVKECFIDFRIPYEKGRGFRYYLDAVGGVDAKGWKKKATLPQW